VWVGRCAARLSGSSVVVAAVVGFPLGAIESATKAAEAARAVERGARELDMVAALGAMKAGDWAYATQDVADTVRAAEGRLVKVIIESALLSPAEIVRACEMARDAGAGYVKTSTGYHARGGAIDPITVGSRP
jgi:deoxyribose-phosphate aldolase